MEQPKSAPDTQPYQDCVVEGYTFSCARDDGIICPDDDCDALNMSGCNCAKSDCPVNRWVKDHQPDNK